MAMTNQCVSVRRGAVEEGIGRKSAELYAYVSFHAKPYFIRQPSGLRRRLGLRTREFPGNDSGTGGMIAGWNRLAYAPRMHAETLTEILHAQPFHPFTVHTVSGETYLVDHPDFVWLPRGGRTVYISLPGGAGERVRLVDTALIERLETNDVHQPN